jgi:hypothetical protein
VPISYELTAANVADALLVRELLAGADLGEVEVARRLLGDLAYRSGSLAAELAERGMLLLTSEKADRRPPVRQQVKVCLAALKSVFGMDGTLAKTLTGLATQQGSRRRWRPIHHLRLLHQPDVRLSSRAHQGPVGIKTSQHSSRDWIFRWKFCR